ncbi:MAG: hypothetical protein ABJG15_05000 [Hyphomonadaceae bacterium]
MTEVRILSDYEIDQVHGAGLSPSARAGLRFVGKVAFRAGVAGIVVGVGIELFLHFSE